MTKYKIPTASYLLLMKDEKVLLLRRFNTGWQDGMYSLVSGHLEAGESPTDCIIREAQEESGVILDQDHLECTTIVHRRDSDETYVDFFFVSRTWKGEVKNMEPHKCDDLSWFGVDEVPENTLSYVKRAIEAVRSGEKFLELEKTV